MLPTSHFWVFEFSEKHPWRWCNPIGPNMSSNALVVNTILEEGCFWTSVRLLAQFAQQVAWVGLTHVVFFLSFFHITKQVFAQLYK